MVETAEARTRNVSNVIAGVGLALGALLGLTGTLVAARNLQSACWAVDGVGLIVAGVILGLKYFRKGNDVIGAGFLVFALGSAVMLVGTATTLQASVPSFGAGAALWVAGLLMISLPREFAIWARVTGLIASVLFATSAGRILWGEQLPPIAKPLPYFAYPFLIISVVGWIWKLCRAS